MFIYLLFIALPLSYNRHYLSLGGNIALDELQTEFHTAEDPNCEFLLVVFAVFGPDDSVG